MSPLENILKFHNKELLFRPLLRNLIGFNEWILPSHNDKVPSLWRSPNGIWLCAFTSEEVFHKQQSEEQFITLSGLEVFLSLKSPIDAFVIDPGQEYALQFNQKMFPSHQRWAESIKVEQILTKKDQNESNLSALRNHKGYYLPLIKSES